MFMDCMSACSTLLYHSSLLCSQSAALFVYFVVTVGQLTVVKLNVVSVKLEKLSDCLPPHHAVSAQ